MLQIFFVTFRFSLNVPTRPVDFADEMMSQVFILRDFLQIQTPMEQKFTVVDPVCSSRRPFNNFTDISFLMEVYGEKCFLDSEGIFLPPSGLNLKQGLPSYHMEPWLAYSCANVK